MSKLNIYFMDFLKNLLLSALADPIGFILLHKFVFFAYIFTITLNLYFSRSLKKSERFFYVLNSILLVFLAQIIKLLAKYLNGL